MSLIKFIKNYKKRPKTLFTTPSHGQGDFMAPESRYLLGRKYFKSDFSEADGFDNLAKPSGIIKEAQDNAAKIYNAQSAFFLVNGSSSGIIAAMLATLSRGDKVLIARNCHKAVYSGLVLTGALPLWIMPCYNEEWDIYERINLLKLDEILSKNRDIKAFIITNPTYEGVMTEIYRVAAICKKYDVLLIADEAHGALWNFDKTLGTPAILQGADISIQSLHKTAGAINPAAIMLTGNKNISGEKIQSALNLINTTSPSYPLLINIEDTITRLASKKGKLFLQQQIKNIEKMIKKLKALPNLEVYEKNNDVTKILVKITNMSSKELSDILYDKFDIECELYNDKSVLFLTGIGTTEKKLKKLEKALTKISQNNIKLFTENEQNDSNGPLPYPEVKFTPAIARLKESKETELYDSLNKICAEPVVPYPPGIPILLPGEIIKKEHIKFLKERKTIKTLS